VVACCESPLDDPVNEDEENLVQIGRLGVLVDDDLEPVAEVVLGAD